MGRVGQNAHWWSAANDELVRGATGLSVSTEPVPVAGQAGCLGTAGEPERAKALQ
ncbi:hypothetical protein [Streptomyces sp. NPDC046161]|uniref:hypothetical protein n=1 Tax=Streptomyces sp. NPDC046161 TaxID=3155132 RepID=UPI0033CA5F86